MNERGDARSAMKNQRCQPSWPARKLNAAPRLKSSVRSKKPGMTASRSPSSKRSSTATLVIWSSDDHHQREQQEGQAARAAAFCSGMAARLPAPNRLLTQRPQIDGWCRVGADVGAPVPAAIALGMGAGRHLDRLGCGGRRTATSLGRRRDQHEAQVVVRATAAPRSVRPAALTTTSACSDEPMSPRSRSALEFLEHLRARRADLRPARFAARRRRPPSVEAVEAPRVWIVPPCSSEPPARRSPRLRRR